MWQIKININYIIDGNIFITEGKTSLIPEQKLFKEETFLSLPNP
jgi:hypothetical protein